MKSVRKTMSFLDNNHSDLREENIALKILLSKTSLDIENLFNQLKNKDLKLKEQGSQLKEQNSQIKNSTQELKSKDFEIKYYKKLIFGRRSEKAKYLTIDDRQLSFFDEIERYDDIDEENAETKLSDDVKEILKERARLKSLEKEYQENNNNKNKKGRKLFKVSNPNIIVERKEIDLTDTKKEMSLWCLSYQNRRGNQ